MAIIINRKVWSRVYEYYDNVEIKYPNTWNINDTIRQIDKIQWVINNFESICALSREPIIPFWKRMKWRETWHKKSPWHFAFEQRMIHNNHDYIYIQDAEHQDNIKENTHTNERMIIEYIQFNTMMNTKNRIRLTESQLNRVIKESVNKILNEIGDTARGQYMLGRLSVRNGEPDEYTLDDWDEDEIEMPITDYAQDARMKPNFQSAKFSPNETPFELGRGDALGYKYVPEKEMDLYRHFNNLPKGRKLPRK